MNPDDFGTDVRSFSHALDYHHSLVNGLVGPHRRLYQTSASFKSAIDGLVSILPMMVNGLVAEAEKHDEWYLRKLASMKFADLAGADSVIPLDHND